jgi:ribosomal RNA-processing protein 7
MPKATKATKPTRATKEASKAKKAPKASTSKDTSAPAKLYSSFLPLPVTLPSPVPIASSSKAKAKSTSATHYLYVRPHKSSPASEDDERTLFVANLPADADAHALRTLFGRWGVVESVEMTRAGGGDVLEAAVRGLPVDSDDDDSDDEDDEEQQEEDTSETPAEPTFAGTDAPKLPRSQRKRRKPNTLPPSVPDVSPLPLIPAPPGVSGTFSCRVVFVDAVSIPRVMGYSGAALLLDLAPFGLTFFEEQYAALRPPMALVRDHADTAMARHDHLHSLLLSSRARASGAGALVDEDGFTVVVRGGRYGRTAGRGGDPGGAGVAVASRNFKVDEGRKKKGSGPLENFYKFQLMDRKRKGESSRSSGARPSLARRARSCSIATRHGRACMAVSACSSS